MEIRFFEDVYGTMGSYGYGEMTVSKYFANKYGNMESFKRNELFAEMYNSMHPLSKRGVVIIDNAAFYVTNIDGIEVTGSDSAELFLNSKRILYKEK